MTLDETINEAKITAVVYEKEARKCIQHGGSFYEEKANALTECTKELEQVVKWLEELKAYRKADRPQGKWLLIRTSPTKLHDEHIREYKCSECYRGIRCTESQLVNYPYCHCGAKMDKE